MTLYCADSYTALLRYAAFGLPPGSFGTALLLGDAELAYRTAHRLLVPPERGGGACEDVVRSMLDLVEDRFPPLLRGSQPVIGTWIRHGGFAHAPKEMQALFLVFCNDLVRKQVVQLIKQSR